MLRKLLAMACFALLVTEAHAQATTELCVRATPTGFCQAVNATTPLPVTGGGGGGAVDQGTPAATANSWPVKITDGVNGPADILNSGTDGVATVPMLGVYNQNMLWNGSTLSLQRDMPGAALTTGFGVAAAAIRSTDSANAGIISVVSAAAGNNLVLKASAGNLYSAYATNLTATAGFLVILNAVSSPADGAITPLECAPLPANGNVSISYNPGPAARFGTGITAVVTSAATCFTKTTGVITAFIKGSVQ